LDTESTTKSYSAVCYVPKDYAKRLEECGELPNVHSWRWSYVISVGEELPELVLGDVTLPEPHIKKRIMVVGQDGIDYTDFKTKMNFLLSKLDLRKTALILENETEVGKLGKKYAFQRMLGSYTVYYMDKKKYGKGPSALWKRYEDMLKCADILLIFRIGSSTDLEEAAELAEKAGVKVRNVSNW
jgi:hypothetical protein